jgi:hypothetical protein
MMRNGEAGEKEQLKTQEELNEKRRSRYLEQKNKLPKKGLGEDALRQESARRAAILVQLQKQRVLRLSKSRGAEMKQDKDNT